MKQTRAYCEENPKLAAAAAAGAGVGAAEVAAMGGSGGVAAGVAPPTLLSFVRADVGRLPFATGRHWWIVLATSSRAFELSFLESFGIL